MQEASTIPEPSAARDQPEREPTGSRPEPEDASMSGPVGSQGAQDPEETGVFECQFPRCEKRFTTKFSLKRHYYIHSRQKTYRCQFCTKMFALPQYLKEHQYTHTN